MIVLNVRWEDRVAVEDAETGEQIRYGELASKVGFPHTPAASPVFNTCHLYVTLKVEALASSLVARGFGAGDVIAVLLPNCIQVQYPSYSTFRSLNSNFVGSTPVPQYRYQYQYPSY